MKRRTKILLTITLLIAIADAIAIIPNYTSYPIYRYNKCTNKWAVQASKKNWLKLQAFNTGSKFTNNVIFPNTYRIPIALEDTAIPGTCYSCYQDDSFSIVYVIDTTLDASLGEEYGFSDSLQATKAYKRAIKIPIEAQIRKDEAIGKRAKEKAEAKRVADSIFNCQHGYK